MTDAAEVEAEATPEAADLVAVRLTVKTRGYNLGFDVLPGDQADALVAAGVARYAE